MSEPCAKCGGDTCDHRRVVEAEYEIGVLRDERDAACREGRDVLARLMEATASLATLRERLAACEGELQAERAKVDERIARCDEHRKLHEEDRWRAIEDRDAALARAQAAEGEIGRLTGPAMTEWARDAHAAMQREDALRASLAAAEGALGALLVAVDGLIGPKSDFPEIIAAEKATDGMTDTRIDCHLWEVRRLAEASVAARAALPAPGRGATIDTQPTHRCKVCGALWEYVPEGPDNLPWWTLLSPKCRPCCDNVPMGEQIEPIAAPGRGEEKEDGRG